jgi:hypothetical protein
MTQTNTRDCAQFAEFGVADFASAKIAEYAPSQRYPDSRVDLLKIGQWKAPFPLRSSLLPLLLKWTLVLRVSG